MTTWFTSDQHFGHHNIIEYCDRPFRSIFKMDEAIINNHNEVVSENDDTFMLGDLSIYTHKATLKEFLNRLKGRKHMILGNHDRIKNPKVYIDVGFTSVHYPYLEIEEFTCIHNPNLGIDKNKKYLCGHVHNFFKKRDNCFNVGVDVSNFYPNRIDTIREAFNG